MGVGIKINFTFLKDLSLNQSNLLVHTVSGETYVPEQVVNLFIQKTTELIELSKRSNNVEKLKHKYTKLLHSSYLLCPNNTQLMRGWSLCTEAVITNPDICKYLTNFFSVIRSLLPEVEKKDFAWEEIQPLLDQCNFAKQLDLLDTILKIPKMNLNKQVIIDVIILFIELPTDYQRACILCALNHVEQSTLTLKDILNTIDFFRDQDDPVTLSASLRELLAQPPAQMSLILDRIAVLFQILLKGVPAKNSERAQMKHTVGNIPSKEKQDVLQCTIEMIYPDDSVHGRIQIINQLKAIPSHLRTRMITYAAAIHKHAPSRKNMVKYVKLQKNPFFSALPQPPAWLLSTDPAVARAELLNFTYQEMKNVNEDDLDAKLQSIIGLFDHMRQQTVKALKIGMDALWMSGIIPLSHDPDIDILYNQFTIDQQIHLLPSLAPLIATINNPKHRSAVIKAAFLIPEEDRQSRYADYLVPLFALSQDDDTEKLILAAIEQIPPEDRLPKLLLLKTFVNLTQGRDKSLLLLGIAKIPADDFSEVLTHAMHFIEKRMSALEIVAIIKAISEIPKQQRNDLFDENTEKILSLMTRGGQIAQILKILPRLPKPHKIFAINKTLFFLDLLYFGKISILYNPKSPSKEHLIDGIDVGALVLELFKVLSIVPKKMWDGLSQTKDMSQMLNAFLKIPEDELKDVSRHAVLFSDPQERTAIIHELSNRSKEERQTICADPGAQTKEKRSSQTQSLGMLCSEKSKQPPHSAPHPTPSPHHTDLKSAAPNVRGHLTAPRELPVRNNLKATPSKNQESKATCRTDVKKNSALSGITLHTTLSPSPAVEINWTKWMDELQRLTFGAVVKHDEGRLIVDFTTLSTLRGYSLNIRPNQTSTKDFCPPCEIDAETLSNQIISRLVRKLSLTRIINNEKTHVFEFSVREKEPNISKCRDLFKEMMYYFGKRYPTFLNKTSDIPLKPIKCAISTAPSLPAPNLSAQKWLIEFIRQITGETDKDFSCFSSQIYRKKPMLSWHPTGTQVINLNGKTVKTRLFFEWLCESMASMHHRALQLIDNGLSSYSGVQINSSVFPLFENPIVIERLRQGFEIWSNGHIEHPPAETTQEDPIQHLPTPMELAGKLQLIDPVKFHINQLVVFIQSPSEMNEVDQFKKWRLHFSPFIQFFEDCYRSRFPEDSAFLKELIKFRNIMNHRSFHVDLTKQAALFLDIFHYGLCYLVEGIAYLKHFKLLIISFNNQSANGEL